MLRIALLSLALAASSTAALAQSDEQVPSLAVNFTDLNLQTPAGAHTLVTRIAEAAAKVCQRDYVSIADVVAMNQFKICRDAAMVEAITAINNPLVFAAAHQANPYMMARR